MQLGFLSALALGSLAVVLGGCSGSQPGVASDEQHATSADAGADAGPRSEVTPYDDADVGPEPKMRWSIDGAPSVDAHEPELMVVVSGADRRFRLTGMSPVRGGKPAVYVEFGRGDAVIERGVYHCSLGAAAAVIARADGSRIMTPVAGGASRRCEVAIDTAVDVQASPTGVRPRSVRRVTGRVTAELGPREDASAPTTELRAAFAATFVETPQR